MSFHSGNPVPQNQAHVFFFLDQVPVEKILLENKYLETLKGISVMFGTSLHELKQ